MKIKNVIASLVAITAIVGCTAAERSLASTLISVSGAACEAVFVAEDPSQAPLCTTGAQIAQAVDALAGQLVSDAGAAPGMGSPAATPTNAQVYAWLKAHGAQPVKQ
jgi:sorbitol-specific phosphotransferase system component IIBC